MTGVVSSSISAWIVLVLAAWIPAGISALCSPGLFGQDCEYSCNCPGGCDVQSGTCPGPCDTGWEKGSSGLCQKQNVALGKPCNGTVQSGQTMTSFGYAVNGDKNNTDDINTSSCFHTFDGLKYAEWLVDLGREFSINSVYLLFHSARLTEMREFVLSVLLQNNTWHPCYTHDTNSNVLQHYVIPCRLTARYVRLSNFNKTIDGSPVDAHLHLCEIEVFACAEGTYGEECQTFCHCRKGGCDVTYGFCLQTNKCRDGWRDRNCSLACVANTYGADCAQKCGQCLGEQACNHVTGSCANGCVAGRQDPLGGCHRACIPGTFGVNCSRQCGSCKNKETCAPTTGECNSGCEVGFTGPQCWQTVAEETGNVDVGMSTTAMVGAIGGGAAVFLILTCVVAQVIKKRKRARFRRKADEINANGLDTASSNPIVTAALATSKVTDRRKSSIFRDRKLSIFSSRKQSTLGVGGERKRSIFAAVFGFGRDEDLSGLPVYSNPQLMAMGAEDNLYGASDDKSQGVLVDSFRQYVYGKRRGINSLENEFKSLPSGCTGTFDEAEKIENKDKNTFAGYYPYDFNRVVLRQWGHGDYINASYIKDYKGQDMYIAAQGPSKKTILDFWHMIWQENIGKIVMLTNFVENKKVRCDRYWSDNACVTYGDITVKDSVQTVRATYVIRLFKLIHKKTSEAREVKHFHFTEWPDHGIPLVHDLLDFIWRVKAVKSDFKGPLLVHCSTGVGRTGTYLAIDSLLQEAQDTGRLDTKTYVERLRHQRKGMVATKEQYAFLHAALIDGIILGDTRMNSLEYAEGFQTDGDQLRIGYRQICEQFHELSYLKSALAFRRDSGIENSADLRNMNCDGISMQFVPSTLSANMLRLVDAFEDTDVQKFMTLLRNINAMTVICLHEQDLEIITRCLSWSRKKEEEMEVKRKEREKRGNNDDDDDDEPDFYRMEELSSAELSTDVTAKQLRVFVDEYEDILLELIYVRGWSQGEKLLPPSMVPAVILIADHICLRQEELGQHPVVLLCGEVQETVGLFCVLTNIAHGIQLDDEVEIYSNVCRVRRLLPEIVTSLEEFHFCHEFAAKYVEAHKAKFHL